MTAPAEVASIDQVLQIGIETTPGTVVPATKRLVGVTTFDPTPNNDVDTSQRGVGQKVAQMAVVGKEFTTVSVAGQLTYDDIVYWLNIAMKTGVIGAGGDASTRYHTFAWSQTSQETYSAATFEHGDSIRAHQIPGCVMPDFAYTLDLRNNSSQWSGSLVGFPLIDNQSLTGALSAIATTPETSAVVDVFLDTTYAGVGGTKLTRVLKVDYSMSGHWAPFFTLNSTNARKPVGMIEMPPTVQMKLTVAANTAGMALLASLRLGSLQVIRVKATGPVAGSSTQNIQHDLVCRLSAFGTLKDENGLVGAEATFDMQYDPTGAANQVIRVENLLTAL